MNMRPDIGLLDKTGVAGRSAAVPILLGVVVLVVALACGVYVTASRLDQTSRAREEQLVANGLQLRSEEIRRSLAPNTIWDDAVSHLDLKFDPGWARDFTGQYFWHTDGYALEYVLDRDGAPIFAFERGRVVDPARFGALKRAVGPLVSEIRAREAARAPARLGDTSPSAPIDASVVAPRGGQAILLAAALVQTDRSSQIRPGPRAPIVVVGEPVDAAFIAQVKRRYLLDDLRIVPASGSPRGYDSVPVSDSAGRVVVRLAWKPHSPIARLLGIAGPELAAAFLTLVIVAGALLRHEGRRNEALLSATGDAQAASSAKSAFLATMSHEIRTPLNGVLGMIQAMAMDPLSRAQRARLDVVRQSGEALLAILNDVLDLSKIEAGKLQFESIDFDLGELMQGAYAAFTALANSKGLSFGVDISGAEGTYRGDPTRIRQILYNLISNELKFTASGEIRVRAQSIPDGLRLSVSDTGEGIAPEKLSQLFVKFTQADASTTRRFGGTGLGLSICRELAERMCGCVDAVSTPGGGSTFNVTLKVAKVGGPRDVAVLPSPETAANAGGVGSLRVLVAEDNRMNQLVIRTLLHQIGIDPAVVDNGAAAVEAWEVDQWDLILMDVQMPVTDGLDATKAIRAREAKAGRPSTPIVALSANAMSHQVAEYLTIGMNGYVTKPIEAKALFEALVRFTPHSSDNETRARGAAQVA